MSIQQRWTGAGLIGLLLAVLIVSGAAAQPAERTPTPTPPYDYVLVGPQGGLLRSGPGTGFSRLGEIFSGEQVFPVGRDADANWVLLRRGDGFVWMSADLGVWSTDLAALPVLEFGALTPSPTFTVTRTPSATRTPAATRTSSPTQTPTFTRTATASATASATVTPTITPSSTLTHTPTLTVTPAVTLAPTTDPVLVLTVAALAERATLAAQPTDEPTATVTPSVMPTDEPTATITPSATATDEPTATITPSVMPTDEPTATVTPSVTPTAEPTAEAAVLVTPPTEPVEPLPGDAVPPPSIPPELIAGGILLLIGAGYGLLYWRGQAAVDRYAGGFVIERCPVCGGDLIADTRQTRLLGIPRARTTVRCTVCRSVLREAGERRWRYAVDPAYGLTLYQRFNGRVIDEETLRALAADAPARPIRMVGERPAVDPDSPAFIDGEDDPRG